MQTANIRWIIEKAREFQKNIYFCFIDYAKAFGCVDHNKLWKIFWVGNTRSSDLPTEKCVCRSRKVIDGIYQPMSIYWMPKLVHSLYLRKWISKKAKMAKKIFKVYYRCTENYNPKEWVCKNAILHSHWVSGED